MQQVTGRRERKNARLIAVICVGLLVLTFVISELKPWSRKPADAGECSNNGPEWRQNALQSKVNGTDAASLKSRPITILDGSRWDSDNHLWVVPFRTAERSASASNFVALIHCTGSVDIQGAN